MAETTEIAWCDSTFNPWTGCTKVSPGCANCYAEKMCNRFGHLGSWGPGAERKRTGPGYWRKPLAWEREGATGADLWDGGTGDATPHSRRVFCGSLCDWLDPEVPAEWLADLLGLIDATPHLDWLLLTKRPHLWRERLEATQLVYPPQSVAQKQGKDAAWAWLREGRAPKNVWIGTTVEDQQRADERIPELLEIPARVRFLSCEPLLGEVDLLGAIRHVDWVICGGESGPNARPMHPDWARSLRDQCKAAGVPFMFKQWGEWAPDKPGAPAPPARIMARDGRSWASRSELVPPARSPYPMIRVGKKAAGRLLDGVTHNEFPA